MNRLRSPGTQRAVWAIVAVAVAILFYVLAINGDVYADTSPRNVTTRLLGAAGELQHPAWISIHVILRKLYSIGAFAIVAFSANRALGASSAPKVRAAIVVALYSAVIEVGQYAQGYPETAFSRAFDILCGAVGGWIGVTADRMRLAGRRAEEALEQRP